MWVRAVLVVTGCLAGLAQAQSGPIPAVELYKDVRGDTDDQMVLPERTITLTPVVRFLTADRALNDRSLAFTDVLLVDLDARASLGGVVDVSAGATLLPKQPAGWSELAFQGARLGARLGLPCPNTEYERCRSPLRFALALDNGLLPLTARQGFFSTSDLTAEAKFYLHETVFVRGALGGAFNGLWWGDGAPPGGFGEVVTHLELVFRARQVFAAWASAELRLPVGAWNTPSFTPTTRVSAALGVAATYIDAWDLFAELRVVDRGDAVVPGTTLGVLDGGFDQQQFLVGITHRFDLSRSR